MLFFLFCICVTMCYFLCWCIAGYEIPGGMSQMFDIEIKTNLNYIYQLISVSLSFCQSQPLKSLRRLLHLSPSSSNQGQPPPPPPDLRFQPPLPNPPQPSSKAGYPEGRGHAESRGHSGVSSSSQAKSRKASYPLPGQIESSWHVSALQRVEGAQFTPEQLGIKPGQNGPTFTRASRTRMPNLNDLKETAL